MIYHKIVDFLEQHLLPCSIKETTGFDCPGCGMQRAFVALLRGDLYLSLTLNPGMVCFLITFIFCLLHLKFRFVYGARILVILFVATVSLMIVNFVVKLSCSL